LLNKAIQNHTFPGCVAIVCSAKGTLFAKAFGTLTYDDQSPQVGGNPKPAPTQFIVIIVDEKQKFQLLLMIPTADEP
jgi:hypothetical protein